MNGEVRRWFRTMRSPAGRIELDKFLTDGADSLGYVYLTIPVDGRLISCVWMTTAGWASYQRDQRFIARRWNELTRETRPSRMLMGIVD